jgi:molybdate transport system ATP-binding protein
MTALALAVDCPGEQGFRLRLTCDVPDRGVTAVYGPSGSGKSTLLDCIAGLRQPAAGGRIHFRGETWLDGDFSLPPWERRVGYVFQDARLFPHLSVEGNLRFALQRRQGDGPGMEAVASWLELDELLPRDIDSLSAGQKQRAALARALLAAPRLMLLDEPLANLDHRASRHLLACLGRVERELGLPMLYVSHDIEEVSQLADHLLLLESGQLAAQGPLLELCSRLDTRLSHAEQAAAIALATVRRHDARFGLTELDLEGESLLVNQLAQAPGSRCRVRIPARDVSICRDRPERTSILNVFPVTIGEIEQTGEARILLRLVLGSQFLLARITRKSAEQLALKPGDGVFAQVKSAGLLSEASEPA